MTQISPTGELWRPHSAIRADANSGKPLRVEVRRRPDASIDLDYYRTRATALRGQAMRDAYVLRWACCGLVAIAMTFVALLFVASALTYPPNGETALIQTGTPRFK
jgi:hypothetical protein